MKLKNIKVDLVKLPANIEMLLFLIREELKANKLTGAFNKVGYGTSYYQTDLSSLLLATAGFTELTDEVYAMYCKLIDKHSAKVTNDYEQLMKQTFKVYVKLMNERKRCKKER